MELAPLSVKEVGGKCCTIENFFIFIKLLLNLQVMRACIKSLTSSNFGQIGQLAIELASLERLKFSIDL